MFYVKTASGVKIAVYDYNAKGCKTIFLVHGWPLSHKMYEYQIEMLTRHGYRVVAVDLRGFGNSDVPARGYGYDQMSRDIYDVICALKLTNITLVGFSMGGAVVLRYMRKFKGYGVSKLILLAAAAPCWAQRPGFPYGLSRQSVDELIQLAKTDRPQLCENFAKELFASPQTPAAVNWFEDIALSASGLGTVCCAYSLRDEDGREDLKAVRVPTRIIYGEEDTVVTDDLIQLQHEGIRGSKLYLLEHSGHGVVYDELESFNRDFLEAIEY